jgi:hypothetical protein
MCYEDFQIFLTAFAAVFTVSKGIFAAATKQPYTYTGK